MKRRALSITVNWHAYARWKAFSGTSPKARESFRGGFKVFSMYFDLLNLNILCGVSYDAKVISSKVNDFLNN